MSMKLNHFICPNCGHDFYAEGAHATCDGCQTHFYVAQSQTCQPRRVISQTSVIGALTNPQTTLIINGDDLRWLTR